MEILSERHEWMTRVRKGSFRVFVGFLAVSAVLAIITVLFGEFGDFEARVLATTSIIATVSICCLCCSAYSEHRGRPAVGAVGILLAIAAGVLWVVAVWTDIRDDDYFRASASVAIFAIATAHGLALLVVRMRPAHRMIQVATVALIFGLAGLLSILILFDVRQDAFFKLMAVMAILVALGTLLIPVLGRLARVQPAPTRLVLEQIADGSYRDESGRRYRITPIDEQGSAPPTDGTPRTPTLSNGDSS